MFPNNAKKAIALSTLSYFILQSVPQSCIDTIITILSFLSYLELFFLFSSKATNIPTALFKKGGGRERFSVQSPQFRLFYGLMGHHYTGRPLSAIFVKSVYGAKDFFSFIFFVIPHFAVIPNT